MKLALSMALGFAGLSSLSLSARAQETFDLAWSGAPFGNSAVATGTITMNPSVLTPGYNDNSGFFFGANPFVTALSITISGASSGNGTFTLSDFDTVLIDEGGVNLNFNTQLVGQATAGSPWGTPNGAGGDFNLFNRTGVGGTAPDGSFNFTLRTDAGSEDPMLLTSFTPAGVPEPGTYAMLGSLGLTGAAFLRRRRAR